MEGFQDEPVRPNDSPDCPGAMQAGLGKPSRGIAARTGAVPASDARAVPDDDTIPGADADANPDANPHGIRADTNPNPDAYAVSDSYPDADSDRNARIKRAPGDDSAALTNSHTFSDPDADTIANGGIHSDAHSDAYTNTNPDAYTNNLLFLVTLLPNGKRGRLYWSRLSRGLLLFGFRYWPRDDTLFRSRISEPGGRRLLRGWD